MNIVDNPQGQYETATPLPPQRSSITALVQKLAKNKKFERRIFLTLMIVVDAIMVNIAFRLSHWIRFNAGLGFFQDGMSESLFYDGIMLGVIPVWIVIFAIMGLYNGQNLLGGVREYSLLFNATTLGMLLIITARFAFPETLILARGWVFIAWTVAFILTGLARFMLRRLVYSLRAQGNFRVNAAIVGYNEEGRLMAEQFYRNPHSSFHLVGYIPSQPEQCLDCSQPQLNDLGSLDDLSEIIKTHNISRLILSNSALTREQILSLYRQYGTSKTVDLLLSSGLYEMLTTGLYVQEDGAVPLVAINKMRMTGIDQVMKLIMDIPIALAALIFLSPLFIAVSVIIKMDSPGPVFYRRRVMGINGKEFDAFKFRTMDTRSEEILRSDPKLMEEYRENFKIKDDPRVTRIGKFLRKTSIDELPQLFNVLIGQMSIIGPRMITPEELGKYSQWDMNLLTVKPGITGLWQVRGRSDVSYDERVRLDMYYIRNWSIWLDVQILIQTIPAVLHKRGAY